MVLGSISPNKSSSIVIIHVAIPIVADSGHQAFSAISILIFVASADVLTFTRLFQINIVMRSLSTLLFRYLSIFAPNLRFLINASTVYDGIDMKAISLPEKNADKRKSTINNAIDRGSMFTVEKILI